MRQNTAVYENLTLFDVYYTQENQLENINNVILYIGVLLYY